MFSGSDAKGVSPSQRGAWPARHPLSTGVAERPRLVVLGAGKAPETGGGDDGKHEASPDTLTQLVEVVCQSAEKKLVKGGGQRLAEACYAGMFIALAFVFYITVTTGAGDAPWGLVRLVGALAFSVGLMLVVLLQVELFTGTVLTAMPYVRGAVRLRALLQAWAQVFVGNAVGALFLALLIALAGVWQLNGDLWGIQVINTALYKLHHSASEAFFLGVLCNLLVCLGIWLTYLSRSVLTKAMLLMLPVALFVSSGFEHSIANLFLLPLAWLLKNLIPASQLLSHGLDADVLSSLTPTTILLANLLPVTLGNIVGGALLTGIGFLAVARLSEASLPGADHQNTTKAVLTVSEQTAMSHISSVTQESHTMNSYLTTLTVSSLVEPIVCIERNVSLWQALRRMNDTSANCCAVVAGGGRLVGILTLQDALRGLWAEEFSLDGAYVAGDLMSQTLSTVAPDDSLLPLIEFWVVNRDSLFPVSTEGHWLGGQYQAYEERLRRASASTPSVLPVVQAGVVEGMVRRERLLELMTAAFNERTSSGVAAPVC